MTSNIIAVIALVASFISLIIHYLTYKSDKHKLKARGVILKHTNSKYQVCITVNNAGKRPVAASFVLVKPSSEPGNYFSFQESGDNQVIIEVGSSASRYIDGKNAETKWTSIGEIRDCDFFVQDALGQNHKVKI